MVSLYEWNAGREFIFFSNMYAEHTPFFCSLAAASRALTVHSAPFSLAAAENSAPLTAAFLAKTSIRERNDATVLVCGVGEAVDGLALEADLSPSSIDLRSGKTGMLCLYT